LITLLVYRGINESRKTSNAMVLLKLAVIVLIIVVGAFYIDIENYKPFVPKGFNGIMQGVSAVFFTYIGFDAVSTLAEESKNPQRDLPRGMFYSLIICTVLYILISLVLTGMAPYKLLKVDDPLAFVLNYRGIKWLEYIVSISAIIAMTSVLLVFQMGQPRIWMSMSRDGLLPKAFSKIHPKYKTPGFSTVVTGLVVGVPILFTDANFVLDFTSIGTIFAFILVCGGVLLLPKRNKVAGGFHMPFVNAKFIFPAIIFITILITYFNVPNYFKGVLELNNWGIFYLSHRLMWISLLILSVLAYKKQFSLIPLLGLTTCMYLLTGMKSENWVWFFIWFFIGLILYFAYGYRKSNLAHGK
jgi:amino acid transporter